MSSDNPIDIVLYAAKSAHYCKEEIQKFHYLKEIVDILARRGWSRDETRDLLHFVTWIIDMKDEVLVARFRELQAHAAKEGEKLYVTLLERQCIEEGRLENKIETARRMLARNMSVGDIIDITELPEDEIRALMEKEEATVMV
ncbi:hypothetical protein FACS1894187_07890 [Synergistales bacterium]|nr:hypothetical protein FACS1894187_07890 [Synergistales bacterium]